MPQDSSQLTVGAGSSVGSAAGVQMASSPFVAKPGTTIADATTPFTPSASNPIAPPSYLSSNPKYPLPTDSQGTPAVFGGNAPVNNAANDFGLTGDSLAAYNKAQALAKPVTTSSGSTALADANGNITSPTSFNIDTGGTTSSDMQTNSGSTQSDVLAQHNQYQQALQNVQNSYGYSPAFIAANSAYQGDVANQAQLANQINTAQGQSLGDTLGQVNTTIGRAETGNAAQQAADAVSLQAQTLIRSGNIAGAAAYLQGIQGSYQSVAPGSSVINLQNPGGSPVYSGIGGLSGVNAVDTYNSLQQYYPGANIPPYDQTQSPAANLQIAQNAVANSAQYKSQYLSTYTTPGGGTNLLNKLATAGLQQNSDGTLTLVSGTNASIGNANADALKTLNTNIQTTQAAFNTVNTQFSNVEQLAQRFGLNQTGIPFITQLENSAYAQTPQGAGLVAAFKSTIQELRTNLQAVISRGGSVAGAAQDAANLVPDNLSPSQMSQLQSAIQSNGNSAVSALQQQSATVVNNIAAANGQSTTPQNQTAPQTTSSTWQSAWAAVGG